MKRTKDQLKDYSLAIKDPKLAKEWHPTKNEGLTPKDVFHHSVKKVWWTCKKNHEWQAIINSRSNGSGCPYCKGTAVCEDNSLAAMNPELANEWHPKMNEDLKPEEVRPFSGKKVWWKCEKGHEWQAVIANRSGGNKCPICQRMEIPSEKSLAIIKPELATEWHPKKNGDLSPENVSAYAAKRVWWQCEKGHDWQALVSNRSGGRGCPYCKGKIVCDDNCLATNNKKLAAEWHPTKNGGLTPKDVMPFSSKKVWWKCSNGHEWQAVIANRNNGTGCKQCRKKRRKGA